MNIIRALIITIVVTLGLSNLVLLKKVRKLDSEVIRTKNNLEYYQNRLNNQIDENRVLQLTITDFKQSNDSLTKVIHEHKKKLKIKDKQLSSVASITTILTDTIKERIPVDRDFNVELKPNSLTTIKIQRKDSTITCIPEIYNHQDLFIVEEKVFKNQYKNKFQRFIHFDYKKIKVEKYKIINSNDLLRVTDTRVIKLSK